LFSGIGWALPGTTKSAFPGTLWHLRTARIAIDQLLKFDYRYAEFASTSPSKPENYANQYDHCENGNRNG
jgi:hypothetical protein